jgi:hypothetical protein
MVDHQSPFPDPQCLDRLGLARVPVAHEKGRAATVPCRLTYSHKYGTMSFMKTTLEIPDAIFRRAKTVAAMRGIPFRALVSEALADKLLVQGDRDSKPWMKTFGKLRHLRKETARINRIIEQEFDQIETEDQQ